MENKKFLDREGVKHLWSKLSMQDYPNNETLMAVINAIDETKANKDDLNALISEVHLTDIGTYNDLTLWQGEIPNYTQKKSSILFAHFPINANHSKGYIKINNFEPVPMSYRHSDKSNAIDEGRFTWASEQAMGIYFYNGQSYSFLWGAEIDLILMYLKPFFESYFQDFYNYEEGKLPSIKETIISLIENIEYNKQSDWNQTDETAIDYIKNKPGKIIPPYSIVYEFPGHIRLTQADIEKGYIDLGPLPNLTQTSYWGQYLEEENFFREKAQVYWDDSKGDRYSSETFLTVPNSLHSSIDAIAYDESDGHWKLYFPTSLQVDSYLWTYSYYLVSCEENVILESPIPTQFLDLDRKIEKIATLSITDDNVICDFNNGIILVKNFDLSLFSDYDDLYQLDWNSNGNAIGIKGINGDLKNPVGLLRRRLQQIDTNEDGTPIFIEGIFPEEKMSNISCSCLFVTPELIESMTGTFIEGVNLAILPRGLDLSAIEDLSTLSPLTINKISYKKDVEKILTFSSDKLFYSRTINDGIITEEIKEDIANAISAKKIQIGDGLLITINGLPFPTNKISYLSVPQQADNFKAYEFLVKIVYSIAVPTNEQKFFISDNLQEKPYNVFSSNLKKLTNWSDIENTLSNKFPGWYFIYNPNLYSFEINYPQPVEKIEIYHFPYNELPVEKISQELLPDSLATEEYVQQYTEELEATDEEVIDILLETDLLPVFLDDEGIIIDSNNTMIFV